MYLMKISKYLYFYLKWTEVFLFTGFFIAHTATATGHIFSYIIYDLIRHVLVFSVCTDVDPLALPLKINER